MKVQFLLMTLWFVMVGLPASVVSVNAQQASKMFAKNDSAKSRVESLIQQSQAFSSKNLDSALLFANKAQMKASTLDDDSLSIALHAHKAGILLRMRRFEEAEELLDKNIELAAGDSFILGTTFLNQANLMNFKQEFQNATKQYLVALEILEEQKDSANLGKTFVNLGAINARLKNPNKAIEYLNKALGYVQDNEPLKIMALSNLSGAYEEAGSLDEAIATTHQLIPIAKEEEMTSVLGIAYSNLGHFYLEKKAYRASIENGIKALKIKKQLNQPLEIVQNNLGFAYLELGNLQRALSYLKDIPDNATGELKVLALNNLKRTYEELGDFKQALKYAAEYDRVKDSLNLASQRVQLDDLIEKYESEKKQQQIDLLNTRTQLGEVKIKQQRGLLTVLGIILTLGLALGFLLYREQRTRSKLQTARLQQRLLRTQLNPHFLFHALNSIQNYIYENRKEESGRYLSSFSKLMRSILESSDQDFIPVEEDAKAIADYLHLQELNIDSRLEYHIEVEESLGSLVLIPPMFTQPFVENAIVHGINDMEDGIISINYGFEHENLVVTIRDNGRGFKSDDNSNKLHRSMSLNILEDRSINLRKVHDYDCSWNIRHNGTGTTASLIFPIRHRAL